MHFFQYLDITVLIISKSSPSWSWGRYELSSLRDADVEAQSGNINLSDLLDISGKIGIQTQDPMARKPGQSSHASQRTEPKKRRHRWALGTTLSSYLSQDITEITSLFGVKKNKAVWFSQRKPPSNNVEQARSNLFLFFSMWLPEVILVFISQTSPFQKIILWNLLGN